MQSDYLFEVVKVLRKKFKSNLMLTGIDNIEWFAKCFSVESSDFISNVLLAYKQNGVWDVDHISRALNEVILKSEEYPHLIVCCKTDRIGVYSYWNEDEIVHKVVNTKDIIDKIISKMELVK